MRAVFASTRGSGNLGTGLLSLCWSVLCDPDFGNLALGSLATVADLPVADLPAADFVDADLVDEAPALAAVLEVAFALTVRLLDTESATCFPDPLAFTEALEAAGFANLADADEVSGLFESALRRCRR